MICNADRIRAALQSHGVESESVSFESGPEYTNCIITVMGKSITVQIFDLSACGLDTTSDGVAEIVVAELEVLADQNERLAKWAESAPKGACG